MQEATVDQLAVPRTIGDITLSLEDISIADDSGWRPIDDTRVAELKNAFLRGEYGQNLLRKPSVLLSNNVPVMSRDGLRRLADGKHTVAALQELQAQYRQALAASTKRTDGQESDDDEVIYTQPLLDVLERGLVVTVLEFKEWDEDVTVAWAVSIHDTDVNKFKASSLKDFVSVAHRYKQKVPGGGWKATQAMLEKVYGNTGRGRTLVWRMCTTARNVPAPVLDRLAASWIPNSYIIDNKFFIPSSDTGMTLSQEYMIAAIDLADSDMRERKEMSANFFMSSYCMPMRAVMTWVAGRRKFYGNLADLPAFQRVESFLKSSRARVLVLQCMKTRVPLHGLSDEQPGIDQCRNLVKDLDAMKTAPNAQEGAGPTNISTGSGNALGASTSDPAKPGETEGTQKQVDSTVAVAVVAEEEETDPIREIALGRAELAMSSINYYDDISALAAIVPAVIMPTHKVLIHLDVPTSKIKIAGRLLTEVESLCKLLPTKKYKVIVNCGSRVDYFAAVHARMEVGFAGMSLYFVPLTRKAKQQKRSKHSMLALACPPGDTDEAPSTIEALAARARRGEHTFLRCLCAACPLRPREDYAAMSGEDMLQLLPDCEINPDDKEGGAEDAAGMELEEGGDDDMDGELDDDELVAPQATGEDAAQKSQSQRLIVDLWPFAYGREYHKHIHTALFGAHSLPQHLIHISPSAHPGAAMAAHDGKMQAHMVLDRVREHSKAHGLQVLKASLTREFYREEKKKKGPVAKRWLSNELCFAAVSISEDQVVCFDEVPADKGTPSWRAALDQAPSPSDLGLAVPSTVAKDIEDFPLFVSDVAGVKCLHTSVSLKEGECIVPIRSLLFTGVRNVAEFINAEGNSALLDGPLLSIDGVQFSTGSEVSLFAVQVGASMFVRDFRGKRARPNCEIKATPSTGCSDGFLSFVVRTRTGCGIAAGSPVLADFGETYRQTIGDPSAPSAKRFRGALDALIAKQQQKMQLADAEAAKASEAAGGSSGTASGGAGAASGGATAASGGAGTASGGAGGASGGAGAASGDVVLAKASTLTGYSVIVRDGSIVLTADRNVKIPPRTVLHMFTNGEIKEPPADAKGFLPFKYEQSKQLCVDFTTKGVQPLSEIVKASGSDKIFGHVPFPKGAAPAVLVCKKSNAFLPTTEEAAGLKVAREAGSTVHLLWALSSSTSNKLVPKGVALVTKNQIIVKSGEPKFLK